MNNSNKLSPMKNGKTFKKRFLKANQVEFFARKNKDNKRVIKQARKNKRKVATW